MRVEHRTLGARLLGGLYTALLLWTAAALATARSAKPLASLPAGPPISRAVEPASDSLLLQNVFHIVGIPNLKRNARVDLTLGAQSLLVRRGGKERMSLPYARLERAQILDGTRTYAKAAYAAVIGFGVAGAFLLRKKQHVDTLVIDFQNEQGGQMGLILQVPHGQGAACSGWLKQHGVAVVEPPSSESLPEQKTVSEKGGDKP